MVWDFSKIPQNVHPVAFVAGAYGRPTAYIMSSNESQDLVKPLVVAFSNQIRSRTVRLRLTWS